MASRKIRMGRFAVELRSSPVDAAALIGAITSPGPVAAGGRGGIRVVEAGGRRLAVRAYRHGGLLRAFTGALFLSGRRAASEADVMEYLAGMGVPVATPFAAVTERLLFLKRLYLVTVFEEGSMSLLEYARTKGKRERARAAAGLAGLLWGLCRAGVYHRDLHLENVLVAGGRLVLLDFDRSVRKTLLRKDVESMAARLCRFVEKAEKRGGLAIGAVEKALFIRAYFRLSGHDLGGAAKRRGSLGGLMHRIGWLAESVLYGKKTWRRAT